MSHTDAFSPLPLNNARDFYSEQRKYHLAEILLDTQPFDLLSIVWFQVLKVKFLHFTLADTA